MITLLNIPMGLAIFGVWAGGIFIGLAFGMKIGKYLERIEWNKLIKEGKIPAPKKDENV